MPDSYNPDRDLRPQFLNQVREWINTQSQVFVLARYLRSAGAMDAAICRSFAEFQQITDRVPIGTDIEVAYDASLPLRGIVDEQFMESAARLFEEGQHYFAITAETEVDCRFAKQFRNGSTHAHLPLELIDLWGLEVYFGPCPDFWGPDNDRLISASKGGIDGPR